VFLFSVVSPVKSISLVFAKGHVPNGFSFLCTRDFHRVSVLRYRWPLSAGSDIDAEKSRNKNGTVVSRGIIVRWPFPRLASVRRFFSSRNYVNPEVRFCRWRNESSMFRTGDSPLAIIQITNSFNISNTARRLSKTYRARTA